MLSSSFFTNKTRAPYGDTLGRIKPLPRSWSFNSFHSTDVIRYGVFRIRQTSFYTDRILTQLTYYSQALLKTSYDPNKFKLYDVTIITLARRHNTSIVYTCLYCNHILPRVVTKQILITRSKQLHIQMVTLVVH